MGAGHWSKMGLSHVLLITVLAVASVSVRAEGLDAEIESKFVPAAQATAKAAELGKPLMVLITELWCGACKNLKKTLNQSPEFKAMLDSFVTVHVGKEEAAKWKEQGHGYVPQTYFFSPEGTALISKGRWKSMPIILAVLE